jgi:hypothetical protein
MAAFGVVGEMNARSRALLAALWLCTCCGAATGNGETT